MLSTQAHRISRFASQSGRYLSQSVASVNRRNVFKVLNAAVDTDTKEYAANKEWSVRRKNYLANGKVSDTCQK